MGEMSLRAVMNKMKPYMLMVVLQFGYAGMFIISVVSLKKGINHYVLVVYRNAFAVVAIAPFALWFESKWRPRMTSTIFLKILAMGFLEPVLDQNLYYVGTVFTSASFAAALVNILPATAFLMASILRIERISIKSRRSQAKIFGTLVTVAGAVLMILYKGSPVALPWMKGREQHGADTGVHDERQWIMGTFMLIACCVCWSAFFILQANTLKSYPAELSLVTLICLMGMVESATVALIMERGLKPWLIGWDSRLYAALYSGVICSGVTYYIQGIVMQERGPVFVTAFQPLCMIIVAVLGSIILYEEITFGRMIGAAIIVIGLYFLIWGKAKDHHLTQSSDKLPNSANSIEKQAVVDNLAADNIVIGIPTLRKP